MTCAHEDYDAYPSSIPRFGPYGVFDVTCGQCGNKIGKVWWEESRPLFFELVTDSKIVSEGSHLKLKEHSE